MTKSIKLKAGEIVVHENDFGILVEEFIRHATRPNNRFDEEWLDQAIRRWWPSLEAYYVRHCICTMEVAIALDEPPRYNRQELCHKDMWKKLVADLRPPRSAFTIDYHCHKCKTRNVKLWRGVHGREDKHGHGLLCASCLAPGHSVDEGGKWQEPDTKYKDAEGKPIPGMLTDQVKGWLPAVPVDNTYWGYSSVPSQDVEWWQALPTYQK